MNKRNKTLIVVAGPTAIGKTDKAIVYARLHACPVISADSRQVYRELCIGVARPSREQLEMAEHQLIGHVSIHETYNAGSYAKEARGLINQLFKIHDTLVVCGGTGLYLRALLNGLDALPERNEILRESLQAILSEKGISTLQKRLLDVDPERYRLTDLSNPQRLIRAIEIAESPLPEKEPQIPAFEHRFETVNVMMDCPRDILYDRINSRVDRMIQDGLEQEAQLLYPFRHLNALQTVGYSEWWPYFEGQYDLATVVDKIKQHTRNYAKRQLTWFRNQK